MCEDGIPTIRDTTIRYGLFGTFSVHGQSGTRQFGTWTIRYTNSVEVWHRSYNATVGCHHPNIWKQAKFIAGAKPTKRRKYEDK